MELEKYKKLLKRIEDTAPDERVYQTVVIQPFLEDVLIKDDIQVIDTSWTRETKNHTKKYYTFPSEKNNCGTSPDIIISKEYSYYNTKNKNNDKTKILACIDVKIPGAKDIPGGVKYIHSCEQMARYLQVVDTAILTNCTEWFFYKRNDAINKDEVKYYLEKFPRIRIKKLQNERKKLENLLRVIHFFRDCVKM